MNIPDGTADDGAASGTILAINPGSASLKAALHNRDGHRLLDLHVDQPAAVVHRLFYRLAAAPPLTRRTRPQRRQRRRAAYFSTAVRTPHRAVAL